ncbi:hypothetical protein M408DRAFT_89951 [Serendipita vermifera MAFF 305830]|uniref:Uncharacterized protein n=1 Tax=Serendipita vermifera MAFF 305830 TaxID=933852 RepID=A0A0C3BB58_SERVB|nr:hypothetical protein M408DRAFT_89951 [Serendipita vermifera MAFF 305830]
MVGAPCATRLSCRKASQITLDRPRDKPGVLNIVDYWQKSVVEGVGVLRTRSYQ